MRLLIVFDRAASRIVAEQEFADDEGAAAIAARLDAEDLHRESSNVEVIVLSGESRDSMNRTHSRYSRR